MRIKKVTLDQIQYETKPYEESLYESVMRIGFSFPIYVNVVEHGYRCVDGHKRLSVLCDILKDHPDYRRGNTVNIVVKNNEDVRSNDCWRGRNTH